MTNPPIVITNTPAATPEPVPEPPEPAVTVPEETTAPTIVQSAPVFLDTWIPLESWCDAAGVARPKLAHENATHTYLLPAPGGPATLTAGRRVAEWGGIEFWLGYAPRVTNQLLYVHAADAQKTILPLVMLKGLSHDKNRCVVIDPGHGGRSVGTKNIATGRYEKDYTLDWAIRLQTRLATNGWKVMLTRCDDSDIALSNRVAVAEQCHASLFISLHFNSGDTNRERHGIATYCMTPTGLPSSLTRDPQDEAHNMRTVYPNHAYDFLNFQYALKIHRSLVRETGLMDHGVQRARFMAVLRGQNRPAILIEGGYLSNYHEARQIADPSFREKLAEAVAKALIE